MRLFQLYFTLSEGRRRLTGTLLESRSHSLPLFLSQVFVPIHFEWGPPFKCLPRSQDLECTEAVHTYVFEWSRPKYCGTMTLYVADDRDSICVLAGITSKALLTTTLTPTLYDMRMTTVSFTPSIRRQLLVANPHCCCCRFPLPRTLSQTSVCWHMHWHFLPINQPHPYQSAYICVYLSIALSSPLESVAVSSSSSSVSRCDPPPGRLQTNRNTDGKQDNGYTLTTYDGFPCAIKSLSQSA